jgi:arsenate reductase (thioredoxin)
LLRKSNASGAASVPNHAYRCNWTLIHQWTNPSSRRPDQISAARSPYPSRPADAGKGWFTVLPLCGPLNPWFNFHAYSAGSFPKGQVHPLALDLLNRMNLPVEGFRSKSWDEFAAPGAPPIDFIFTVCDNAAGEVCPVWPGKPMTAHWGIADPAAVEGTDADKAFAFRKALKELETRIRLFTILPIESLDGMTLQAKLRAIGKSNPAPEPA